MKAKKSKSNLQKILMNILVNPTFDKKPKFIMADFLQN